MKALKMLDLTDQATDIGSEWFSGVGFDQIWIDADITAITGGSLVMRVQVLTPKAVAENIRPPTTTGTDLDAMRLWDAANPSITTPDQISWMSSKYTDPIPNTQAVDTGNPAPIPPWFRVYMNTTTATWTGTVYVMLW